MPRVRRPFERPVGKLRDARLIVIATEDTKAAKAYFDAMASPNYYQSSKVHVAVLSRRYGFCTRAYLGTIGSMAYSVSDR